MEYFNYFQFVSWLRDHEGQTVYKGTKEWKELVSLIKQNCENEPDVQVQTLIFYACRHVNVDTVKLYRGCKVA